MKWTKKEIGILGGCILLMVCLIAYGTLKAAPRNRQEKIVREVLEKIYFRDDDVILRMDELLESMAGSTIIGEGVDEPIVAEGYGLMDYFKDRFGDYFTEQAYEQFVAVNCPLNGYFYYTKTGGRLYCEGLELEEDKKVENQYRMTIHLVRKDAEGETEKVADYGNVRFDENDKIAYWNDMENAVVMEK